MNTDSSYRESEHQGIPSIDSSPNLLNNILMKDKDHDNFMNLESINNYLQSQYGYEKYKKIHEKVSILDEEYKGRIYLDKYYKELNGYLTPEQVTKHIGLFLVTSRLSE